MRPAEWVGILGAILAMALTFINIRKGLHDAEKVKVHDALDASTMDEQRLTIVANSAQVATGFLQDVLKRADQELAARDRRIAALEQELAECRRGK